MSYRKEKIQSLLGIDTNQLDREALIEHSNTFFQNGMHGLCFSPYEEGQKPGDPISDDQIRRKLALIAPHTKWIRTFSCTEGNERIPKIAREFNLKNLVGAWLGEDNELNEAEIEGLIELTDRPNITENCDVILANCYPYWEGCSIEYSLVYMKQMYYQAMAAGNGKKVIITETGWPSQGENLAGAYPGYENALKYFINAQNWSKEDNIEMFYFSAFDESWKISAEGDVGAYWGIWDKDENLKF